MSSGTIVINGSLPASDSFSWGNLSPVSWSISNTGTNWTIGPYDEKIVRKGDLEVEGDITIKGVSLSERLDKIEERLAILRPNNELEAEWEELRELGERYRKLEQDLREKQKIWELLNK